MTFGRHLEAEVFTMSHPRDCLLCKMPQQQFIVTVTLVLAIIIHTGWSKSGYQVLFGDNFGNSAPILTVLSLLQTEIYGA